MSLGVIGVALVVLVAILWAAGILEPGVSPTQPPASASHVPRATPGGEAPEAPRIAWERLPSPQADSLILGMALVEGRWFALGATPTSPKIWFSDDAGGSWTPAAMSTLPQGVSSVVTELVAAGDELFASGIWGREFSDQAAWTLWRSSDGGQSWAQSREDRPAFSALIQAPDGLVGAGWEGMVTPTTAWIAVSDDGDAWSRIDSQVFAGSAILGLATLEGRLVAIGFRDENGSQPATWFSDDGGDTWQHGAVGGSGPMLAIVEAAGTLVAVGGTAVPTAWQSNDGATWSTVEFGEGGTPRAVAAVSGGYVAVGNASGAEIGVEMAWASADGVSWTSTEIAGGGSVAIGAAAADGRTVLAGGSCVVGSCESVLWRGTVED